MTDSTLADNARKRTGCGVEYLARIVYNNQRGELGPFGQQQMEVAKGVLERCGRDISRAERFIIDHHIEG